MEVLSYQLGILAIIIIIGSYGNSARNSITVILAIFTLFAVFMSWLIILQLVTIAIGYSISTDLGKNSPLGEYSLMSFFIKIIVIVIVISSIIHLVSNIDKKESNALTNDTIPQDTTYHDRIYRDTIYNNTYEDNRFIEYTDSINYENKYNDTSSNIEPDINNKNDDEHKDPFYYYDDDTD